MAADNKADLLDRFPQMLKHHQHCGNNHTQLLPKINRALNRLVKATSADTDDSCQLWWSVLLTQDLLELLEGLQVLLLGSLSPARRFQLADSELFVSRKCEIISVFLFTARRIKGSLRGNGHRKKSHEQQIECFDSNRSSSVP